MRKNIEFQTLQECKDFLLDVNKRNVYIGITNRFDNPKLNENNKYSISKPRNRYIKFNKINRPSIKYTYNETDDLSKVYTYNETILEKFGGE